MKVSEAVAELLKLPQDLELLDESEDLEVSGFTLCTYGEGNSYVAVIFADIT